MQITWTITNNCEYIPDENEWPTTTNEITKTKVPKKYDIFDKKFKFVVVKYNSINPTNNKKIDFDCKVSRDNFIRSILNILSMSPPRFPAIEKKTIILNKIPWAEFLFKILSQ